jgi:bifunctional non-homologous end joining protein LigD
VVGAVVAKLTTAAGSDPLNAPLRRKLVLDDLAPIIPELPNAIEESDVEKYLTDDRYGMQEKKDGKHLTIYKSAGLNTQSEDPITATNKKGKICGYPKEFEDGLAKVAKAILDGEGIGAVLHAYDLFEIDGEDIRGLGYLRRYQRLSELKVQEGVVIVPLAIGTAAKRALFEKLKKEGREGVVFKLLDEPMVSGKAGMMVKFKFYAELSARVAPSREGKRSIGLELLDDKSVWVPVGNCTIPANHEVPSIGIVVEIKYLYAYPGGSLYQPIYKGPRDDIDAEECLMTQCKYKAEED